MEKILDMEMKNDIRILVVDDEEDIREILQFNLENEGFVVDSADSAEQALKVLSPQHSLILLDVMMGGISGYKMADQLRKTENTTPIIFLTAKGTENDMLTGFSLGADDYISKPFSIKEVIARVKSVIKRSKSTNPNKEKDTDIILRDTLKIDLAAKTVHLDEKELSLTKTEFNILTLLLQNEGRVYSRSEILGKAWKEEGIVLERTVDVHIARLRKKIGKYGDAIVNRTGHGYVFNLD